MDCVIRCPLNSVLEEVICESWLADLVLFGHAFMSLRPSLIVFVYKAKKPFFHLVMFITSSYRVIWDSHDKESLGEKREIMIHLGGGALGAIGHIATIISMLLFVLSS
ncbi:hypothetical protein Y032_0002g898 [Ancylostoma ceylanicum]|uniref:Uncharacterized protein n=1 Tax=Ancylostoma ceylanicum TaxID=53326 RepID=A0A016W2X2_9BILA|nr:hypothetical protein Y032_0002g898 [Ancylostoma ceylanicum]